jgi:uncharacterized linocin/CFP29 family protein
MLPLTGPLGAGTQTVPEERLVGITEGSVGFLGEESPALKPSARSSGVVPLIFKDFVMHWRDVLESRVEQRQFSTAKAAAAAAFLALEEDKLLLFGHGGLRCSGLINEPGSKSLSGLSWHKLGDAFQNFMEIKSRLQQHGHNGPFAALVHPRIYSDMHRVLDGSGLLEIEHVKSILTSGVFKSPLLPPGGGLVIATAKQNAELLISFDTLVAFLGARNMNLPFRVMKAVYLRIHRPDAICTFAQHTD